MNKKELDRILRMHQHWILHDCEAWEQMRADLSMSNLSEADLHGADLSEADLYQANLSGATLREADLYQANLSRATLREADLRRADLNGADLRHADLRRADLSGATLGGATLRDADLRRANLNGADLRHADLSGADLRGADLSGAYLDFADIYTADFDKKDEIRKGIVLTKPIKGYKKTAEGVVITAEIPASAIVFSINGSKCRTNMATILDMEGHRVLHSQHDPKFTYKLGKKIIIPNFDTRYNAECGSGFHFFKTKKEAKDY